MKRTLAALAALYVGMCVGSGGAQIGTYEFSIGDLAKYLKYQDRINSFRCGHRTWRIADPEFLGARGVITAVNTVNLRIPWQPETWRLSENYRGKMLPLRAVEVVYNNGNKVERVLADKQYLRYDKTRQELTLNLRLNPDTVRGVVGQVMISDASCSAHILFTVNSLGPG